jgi:hypothetical protein
MQSAEDRPREDFAARFIIITRMGLPFRNARAQPVSVIQLIYSNGMTEVGTSCSVAFG